MSTRPVHAIDELMSPLTIRSLSLSNRFVMSPMTRNFSPKGVPGPDVAAYYRRRAEGGVGLLISEAVCVEHPGAVGDAGLGEHGTPDLWSYSDMILYALITFPQRSHHAFGKNHRSWRPTSL